MDRPKGKDMTATVQEVASAIAAQLGNRFFFMVGGKNLLALESGLSFRFCRNASGANICRITLDGRDEYTVEFLKCRSACAVTVARFEGIQVEGLADCFASYTGLAVRL